MRTIERWGRLLLLLVLFAQMVTSAVVKSPTFDEPAHLFQGCLTWRYGFDSDRPLYWLAGFPCLFAPALPTFDSQLSATVSYRNEFFQRLDFPVDALLFPARVVVMGLTLLLGAILYRWGKVTIKGAGGLIALGLLTYDPNVLAHGSLCTTDLAAAFFFTLTLYLYYQALNKCQFLSGIAAGVSLDLTLRSKPSAPILLLMLGIMTLSWSRRGYSLRKRLGYQALVLLSVLLVASLAHWGLSGFSLQETSFFSIFQPLRGSVVSATGTLVSGPKQAPGWPAYMLGRRSFKGWALYFPLLLAVKTPLPVLIASLIGVAWLVRERRWHLLAAFSLPVWMLAAYTRLALNIGYRHLLPAIPALILLSAYALRRLSQKWPWIAGLFLLWLGIGSLSSYPHYLAYFNEIAGGPAGGIRFFTDSNLDWGQDLKGLRLWMESHGINEIYLSYFGSTPPETYDIRYRPLNSQADADSERFTPITPAPGIYAISATNLTGQYLWENPSVFSWFRYHSPIARIGQSIWVFQVFPDPDPPRWAAVCLSTSPLFVLDDHPPLDLIQELRRGVRDGELLRLIPFDCSQGWPLAHEGGDAWLLIPSQDGRFPLTLPPLGSEAVYRQENYPGDLLFTVFRWKPQVPVDSTLPSALTLGETLRLESAAFSPQTVGPGETVALTLVWRVLQLPPAPISFMAHLWDAEGQPVAVDDGNAVPPEHWQPGDLLVQTHRLSVPPEAQPGRYALVTGAYIVPTIERLTVTSSAGEDLGDFITVGEIQVSQ